MPLASTLSDDFGQGIYRGRKSPANAFYDGINVLLSDEGLPFRRGGSAYYSASDAGSTPTRLAAVFMAAPAANRVIFGGTSATYALDGSLAPVTVSTGFANGMSRPASVGPYAIFANSGALLYYAGSLKSSDYTTGTIAVTAASKTVTGTGTSWSANVDAGMILTGGGGIGVVKSVGSDTQITLVDPWAYSTGSGAAYTLSADLIISTTGIPSGRMYVAAAGSGSPRLLLAVGNRVYYTARGNPFTFAPLTDYHEVPANALIVGAEGRGDSALIFTTAGIWEIGNLSFDDVDAYGNLQHTVTQVSKDVTIWDDLGIAGWAGGLVVPAIDDVFVVSSSFSSMKSVTGDAGDERVRRMYRGYVSAGYQPGQAIVHRGHYMLPILNGTTLVDVFVCRLDRGAAWTRWAGGAASVSYATLIDVTTREPNLLGLKAARVTDLTDCMDGGDSTDADGTTSDLVITTRDFPTGLNQPGFAQKVRVRYEMESVDATVTPAFSSDQDDGDFYALTERGEQDGGVGWVDSDGSLYQWAVVGKRRERLRFRLTVAGATTSFVLRTLELLTRPTGRQ